MESENRTYKLPLRFLLVPIICACFLARFGVLSGVREEHIAILGGKDETPLETQVSLVMPCAIAEFGLLLEQGLFHIYEGSVLPDETLLVLNLAHGSLIKEFDALFGNKSSLGPRMLRLRHKVAKFLKDHIPNDQLSDEAWAEVGYDEAIVISGDDQAFLNLVPSRLIALVTNESMRNTLQSIYALNDGTPPGGHIASVLPNFKVIVAKDDTGAGYTRETGAMLAFDGSPPDARQIVMFQDCDDQVAVQKVGIVREAFNIYAEVDFVATQFQRVYLANDKESNELEGSNDLWSYDETVEDLSKKYIPDRVLLKTLLDMQEGNKLLLVDGELLDPEEISGNSFSKDGFNFKWTLSRQHPFTTGWPNKKDMVHNGNVSWRRSALFKNMPFPKTKRGQDARLIYKAMLGGSKGLGLDGRMMTYTHPSGQMKRKALASLFTLIRELDIHERSMSEDEALDKMESQ